MENKTIRINTDLNKNDKYITFNLEQSFKELKILSMELSQKEVYTSFNSDYGCLVGRVVANGSVGVPNAKISMFIPVDENETDDIRSIYPFKKPTDKDNSGRQYNLLPRVSQITPFIEIKNGTGYRPKVPMGSFPTKEEILTNDVLLDVYKKYYKFSTVTNESGDYMLFGLPVGLQTIHMSVDITDIGKYSMTPPSMIKNLGFPESLFVDNGTLVKKTTNLDDAPNLFLQNVSVDIRPFWGDKENFEIGITRHDFNIKSVLVGNFVVFGSNMTMASNAGWGLTSNLGACRGDNTCVFSTINEGNLEGMNINTYRAIQPNIEVYTISNKISDAEIANNDFSIDPPDIMKLDKTEYSEYFKNGAFVLVIPCNRKKIITNEFGEEEEVDNDDPNGIFTEFNGYMLFDSDDSDIRGIRDEANKLPQKRGQPIVKRSKFKIPQQFNLLRKEPNAIDNLLWIKKNRKFKSGRFYSVSQYYNSSFRGNEGKDWLNSEIGENVNNSIGIIVSDNTVNFDDNDESVDKYDPIKTSYVFPFNGVFNSQRRWGAQWLNMNLFHIQYVGIDRKRDNRIRVSSSIISDNRSADMWFLRPNTQNIGGGRFNSEGFINPEFHYFDFIEVTRNDIITMYTSGVTNNFPKKIFRKNNDKLESDFKYTPHNTTIYLPKHASENTGVFSKDRIKGVDLNGGAAGAYIFKGLGHTDCIKFLFDLNLI